MAACSFDMQFTFVWAGWEGSAHDTRIFYKAIRNTNIQFPGPPEGIYPPNIGLLISWSNFLLYEIRSKC
jgi:hypothetical protein